MPTSDSVKLRRKSRSLRADPAQQLAPLLDRDGQRQPHQRGAEQVALRERAAAAGVDAAGSSVVAERAVAPGGQAACVTMLKAGQLPRDDAHVEAQRRPDQERQRQEGRAAGTGAGRTRRRDDQRGRAPAAPARRAGRPGSRSWPGHRDRHQRRASPPRGRGRPRPGLDGGAGAGEPDAGGGAQRDRQRRPAGWPRRRRRKSSCALQPRAAEAAAAQDRPGDEGLGGVRDAEQHRDRQAAAAGDVGRRDGDHEAGRQGRPPARGDSASSATARPAAGQNAATGSSSGREGDGRRTPREVHPDRGGPSRDEATAPGPGSSCAPFCAGAGRPCGPLGQRPGNRTQGSTGTAAGSRRATNEAWRADAGLRADRAVLRGAATAARPPRVHRVRRRRRLGGAAARPADAAPDAPAAGPGARRRRPARRRPSTCSGTVAPTGPPTRSSTR